MINIAVEGDSDREIARSLVSESGHTIGMIRIAGGKSRLDLLIPKYAAASAFSPWVVLRDSDSQCPVKLAKHLLRSIPGSEHFRLRIANSMAEAWLLGDAERFGQYFGVRVSQIPREPEQLVHAKRALLSLVARSRLRAIRQDMVAQDGDVGPLYVSRINEFAAQAWRPQIARAQCDSLDRAIRRIAEI